MILPKKDKDGNYYISYSQITSWNEAKGFNTGKLGRHEYMKGYFLGEKFPDKGGFGIFGTEVEAFITKREYTDKFTNEEKKVLETITPLGNYQKQFKFQYPNFYIVGYIDDHNNDLTKLRDYKTASKNSAKKYSEDGYNQLDLYGLAIEQEIGVFPKELEVCIIERIGNGFRGGRDVMSVGSEVWYVERKPDTWRLKSLQNLILNTVEEIAKYYEVFLKLNKII